MARILLVKVQSQVFTAKCSEPQVIVGVKAEGRKRFIVQIIRIKIIHEPEIGWTGKFPKPEIESIKMVSVKNQSTKLLIQGLAGIEEVV